MSTRARIGIRLPDGILSAYHHWDGYPDWLGRQLVEHYNTFDEALQLVQGGGMSSCWSQEDWDGNSQDSGPLYYSARGDGMPSTWCQDFRGFLRHSSGVDYCYLFENGQWKCYDPDNGREIAIPAALTQTT